MGISLVSTGEGGGGGESKIKIDVCIRQIKKQENRSHMQHPHTEPPTGPLVP